MRDPEDASNRTERELIEDDDAELDTDALAEGDVGDA